MAKENRDGYPNQEIMTPGEVAALARIKYLERGSRLSYEGGRKWNDFSSHNQVEALIQKEIRGIMDSKSYKDAHKKMDKYVEEHPVGVYDDMR